MSSADRRSFTSFSVSLALARSEIDRRSFTAATMSSSRRYYHTDYLIVLLTTTTDTTTHYYVIVATPLSNFLSQVIQWTIMMNFDVAGTI